MTLDQLLVVQQHDSAIDRLTHQRAHLPEMQALVECDEEAKHINSQRHEVAEQRHALEREQKRLEDEVALVSDRRKSENDRLYSGSVTAHKDLQAIQDELDVLAGRQDQLEEQVLDVMVEAEPFNERLTTLDGQLAGVAERRSKIEASIAESQAQIDAEVGDEQTARAVIYGEIAPEMAAVYERTRASLGGVGIARLNHKTCEGCRLQLAAVAYDRLRKEPAGAIVHCPECGRILVR